MIQSIITWLIVLTSAAVLIRSISKGIKGKSCSCYSCEDNGCIHRRLGTCSGKVITREVIGEDKG